MSGISETYGRYVIDGRHSDNGLDLIWQFRIRDRGDMRKSPWFFEARIEDSDITLERLAHEGIWNGEVDVSEFPLSYVHGLLDFDLFENVSKYVLSFGIRETVWTPSLDLSEPDFDDSDKRTQYHILRALHWTMRALPRKYTITGLDSEGACIILRIERLQFEYNVNRLIEQGWITSHAITFGSDLYKGDFHITNDGIQALQNMTRSVLPKWQTKQAPTEVQNQIPEIVQIIEKWIPKQRFRHEESFESALGEYLVANGIAAPEQQGASLVDILAGYGICIEIKVNPDKGEFDRLFGQMVRHLGEHGNVIVLIIRLDKRDLLDDFQSSWAGDERVKFIVKG